MLFGGKNKKKEEEKEEDSAKIEVKGKLEKKPRKKREKKQKKEPPKPWGRRERYILLLILFSTVLASGLLALMARSWKMPGLPRFELPDDAFEETFVLEGGPSEDETRSEFIINSFDAATKKLSGVYAFYVIDLHSGEKFGLNDDELFQAASLIKLPVMSMMFEEMEDKMLSASGKHSLREEDKIGGSGSLYYQEAGTVVTNLELIEYMGQQSDNTAFNIALNTLGRESVEEYIAEIGMRDTSYETNKTTPRDIANFFRKLWEGRLVNEENEEMFFDFLTDTQYEAHLAAGIPVRVAHKYGREIHVVNDAGVVFGEKPYVVVIMTKGVVETEADQIFPELARIIHEGMTN